MGLLDFFQSEDAQLGIGLLGAAGPRSDGAGFGQRLQEGMGYMQAQKDAKMKREFMGAQMDNYRSEIEARKLATLKDARQQELIQSVFGPGGAQGMSPGAFAPASDGRGPTMPPQMQAQGGGLANMTPDMVARLKLGGLDLTDIYKFSQEPQEFKQGSTYQNRNNGSERFMPKVGEGVAADKFGFYNALPGYGAAQASIEGQKAGAIEGAKANFDTTTYTPEGGRPMLGTRGNLVRSINAPQPGQGSANGDQFAILSQELTRARASGNQSDIAGLEREIARLPKGSQQAASASGLAGGGIPLQSDAEKAGQVTQANANVKPIESRNNALAQTSYMMKSIDGLINHPGLETGTGLSGTLNPKNYIPGTDAKNFGIALDQVKGGTFLQAFESLKSGGAVSEIEGTKATNAIARLNTAQSTTEFKAALTDFKEVMTGVQARQKAAMPGGGQAADAAKPANPGTAFDTKPPAQNFKGKTATGPDGKRYKSDGLIWKEVQ